MAQTGRRSDDDNTGQKKPGDVEAFLSQARTRFAEASAHESEMRIKAVDDLRNKMGEQWPEGIKAARAAEQRPCLTINKMDTFIHQVTNEQRQNRPGIKVSPMGDRGDPETAQMFSGLLRQTERSSRADIAYDTAFELAVAIGWGYWRIVTEYERNDSFTQVARILTVDNPFSIYLDPRSKPDGSDAQWAFVSKLMPKDEFHDLYPDAEVTAWSETSTGDPAMQWYTEDQVRIAEYYYIDHKERELVELENGHVGFEDQLDESLRSQVRRRRTVRVPTVKWCKITARDVLEESTWLGKWIPIVRVVGDVTNVDGINHYSGLVAKMKDAQRMYNFWATSETEMIALAPKAPWIMEEGQIEGYEQDWKNANNKSLPYLLYRGVSVAGDPAPPPQRQQFAGPAQGIIAAKMAAAQDMQAVTGIRFDATMQERSYDESGRALRELKMVGELGSFHYIDNLARSLRFTGQQLIDLVPKITPVELALMILGEDGTEERVRLDPQLPQATAQASGPDGAIERVYNPNVGEYDVTVTVGPNFATKRTEAAQGMVDFMKVVPQAGPLIGDLVAKNMDWPGAQTISERLATMLPPQIADKGLDRLPAQARGVVMSLMQQLQQVTQERDRAAAMLADKEREFQIDEEGLQNERAKISADYEAKMAALRVELETKIAALQADKSIDQSTVQLEKMAVDYEAKMAQMSADYDARMTKIDADREATFLKLAADREKTGQSTMREGDIKQLAGMLEAQSEAFTKAIEQMAKPRQRKGRVKGPSGQWYEMDMTEQ